MNVWIRTRSPESVAVARGDSRIGLGWRCAVCMAVAIRGSGWLVCPFCMYPALSWRMLLRQKCGRRMA